MEARLGLVLSGAASPRVASLLMACLLVVGVARHASADSLLDNPNVTEVGDAPADDAVDDVAPTEERVEEPATEPAEEEPEAQPAEVVETPAEAVEVPGEVVVEVPDDVPAVEATSAPAEDEVTPRRRDRSDRPSTPAVRSGGARAQQLAEHFGTVQGLGILLWASNQLTELTLTVALLVPSIAVLVAQSSGSPQPGQMTIARAYHDIMVVLAVELRALTGVLASDRPSPEVSVRRTGMTMVATSWVALATGLIVAGRNPDIEEATGLRYESAMYWTTMAGGFLAYPFISNPEEWFAALTPMTLAGLWVGHELDVRGRYDGAQLGGLTIGGAVGTAMAWIYYGLSWDNGEEPSDGALVAMGLTAELVGMALGLAIVNPLRPDRLDQPRSGQDWSFYPALLPDGAGGSAGGMGFNVRW